MPTSQHFQINEVMDLVIATNPSKLLDIGIGFGKYGFLSREYLELWDGREKYSGWKRTIDGIEAFEEYITPIHKFIYNDIIIGNALDVLPGLRGEYDLILIIDVLEHFGYEDGLRLLQECLRKGKNILISVPNCMNQQGDVFGNPYEAHLFQWTRNHFDRFPDKIVLRNVGGSLIVYVGEKSRYISRRRKLAFIRKFRKRLLLMYYLMRMRAISVLDLIHLKEPIKRILHK